MTYVGSVCCLADLRNTNFSVLLNQDLVASVVQDTYLQGNFTLNLPYDFINDKSVCYPPICASLSTLSTHTFASSYIVFNGHTALMILFFYLGIIKKPLVNKWVLFLGPV